jgi:hypothetical protein
MTADVDDQSLFRALTTSSTILLKTGLFFSKSYLNYLFIFIKRWNVWTFRRLEIDKTDTEEIYNEWTLSFEQLEAAMNAETSVVTGLN